MKFINVWLWALHGLVFLAAFWAFNPPFAWLLGLVLVLGYVLRMRAAKQNHEMAVRHLTWQINTVWLVLLLWLCSFMFIILIGYWMDSEDPGLKQLDALAASGLPPLEGLRQLWGMMGVKGMVIVGLVGFAASSVWPLSRAVHGMLALRRNRTPNEAHSGAALAFGLAVLLILAALCLSFV